MGGIERQQNNMVLVFPILAAVVITHLVLMAYQSCIKGNMN
jgi:hypothetical protein